MKTVLPANLIAEFLAAHGITQAFDVAGGMIAFMEDAISKTPGIACSPNHHEQACGFAAEGFSRVSGNFGVAMATSGPGATNLVTAIGSCYFDSTPALFITGQVNTKELKKRKEVRQHGFQETDIVTIVESITKYSKLVMKPEDVLYELEKAVFIMRHGRPGPVLLDIPIDVQRIPVNPKKLRRFLGSPEHRAMFGTQSSAKNLKKQIQELEEKMHTVKAPLVIAGGGIRLSGTMQPLLDFLKRNNLPVVTSLMGLDSVPGNFKNSVGFIGSYGNRAANIILANADMVIALGSRLDVRQIGQAEEFAKKCFIVHADIDEYSLHSHVPAHLAMHVSLADFFKQTLFMTTPPKKAWLQFIGGVKKEFGTKPNPEKNIDPNSVLAELSRQAAAKTIVVADVGNHQMWLAQSWKVKPRQRVLFSGGMGSMGFGLPAAIGGYFADPKRPVILVCGDGGFQMNIQELETVRRNKIPLKIFLMNNKSLGMVREFQDLYFNKHYQSTVIGYSVPNMKKIAAAYDLKYLHLVHKHEQGAVIKKMLATPGPVLVEVDLDLMTKMEPKVIFGKPLDDQFPFLNEERKTVLENLKRVFTESHD